MLHLLTPRFILPMRQADGNQTLDHAVKALD
jgi:hypothetical protein